MLKLVCHDFFQAIQFINVSPANSLDFLRKLYISHGRSSRMPVGRLHRTQGKLVGVHPLLLRSVFHADLVMSRRCTIMEKSAFTCILPEDITGGASPHGSYRSL